LVLRLALHCSRIARWSGAALCAVQRASDGSSSRVTRATLEAARARSRSGTRKTAKLKGEKVALSRAQKNTNQSKKKIRFLIQRRECHTDFRKRKQRRP
jgi:alkylated DNA nucleotide flippase Atl1